VLASPTRSLDPLTSPEVRVHFSEDGDDEDAELYALAKTYFDRENYHACAALLDGVRTLSAKGRFLQLYSKLLIYDMHLDQPDALLPRPAYADRGGHDGPRLVALLEHLVAPEDPYLLFLKGVILRKLHKRIDAMDCLLSSVRAFPYNWSAWKELCRTLNMRNGEREQILDLLPNSFMSVFFLEHAQRQSTQVDDAHLERIDALLSSFPECAYLLTSRAQALYLHQELEEAADTFQHALELQPYRLEGISEYSNTLYVLDRADALAQLVQQFAHVTNSAEVWCMKGNFYNQRSEHFRAVESFKQALRLDQECVAAWILLGHEYLELKNSHAAAEMYRRAIEINPHDYRPWHGLGQVYELNEAWAAAIDYYQQCALIRPHDARMWASLGVCYERIGRHAQAIECFRRHLTCPLTQLESVDALARIIDLYERCGDTMSAAMHHCLLVQVIDRSTPQVDPTLVARFVYSYVIAARWEMGELAGRLFCSRADQRAGRAAPMPEPRGDLALAHDYLHKVLLAGTEMTPVAEELLTKLAALRESNNTLADLSQ
jgi:anaphase-promoting complex subunit 8